MGHYTGLWVHCKIKEEFAPVIDFLMNHADIRWENVANRFYEYQFIKDWSLYDRSNFIPFGCLCYMPEDWENSKGESLNHYEKNTRIWHFNCSLKNYNNNIQEFLDKVLPNFVEEIYRCEVLDESWQYDRYPNHYILKDGKIVLDEDKMKELERLLIEKRNSQYKEMGFGYSQN